MVSKMQGDFLWGTLIGTVLGVATALLLTPVSGAKLRQRMSNQYHLLNRKKPKYAMSRPSSRSRSAKTLKAMSSQPKKTHRKHTHEH